jgi:hypothetical protein
VLKLLAKEHYKQPQKSVKMYSKEKCKRICKDSQRESC